METSIRMRNCPIEQRQSICTSMIAQMQQGPAGRASSESPQTSSYPGARCSGLWATWSRRDWSRASPVIGQTEPDQQSVSDRRQKRKKLTVLRQGGTVSKCCHEGSVIMAHPEGLTLSEIIRQRRNNYVELHYQILFISGIRFARSSSEK